MGSFLGIHLSYRFMVWPVNLPGLFSLGSLMDILVTGGAGYLGTVLIMHLLKEGHYVRCLDLRAEDLPSLINITGENVTRLTILSGDMRNDRLLKRSLAGVDGVVHLAAIVGYPA